MLQPFGIAMHVHRPYKREQGEGHPAKRIHQRIEWGYKQRVDVVDQHGHKCQNLHQVQSGRTDPCRKQI
ncbi:hypothetical protein D3C76_965240 [compost metagenome]